MIDARQRRILFQTTAIAVLALVTTPSARASCTSDAPGNHVFALTGDTCTASGAYSPTTPIPETPGNIVGLFAFGGGSIGASSLVSITANAASNSYGAWSDGGAIGLSGPVTITTSGGRSYGFYATNGGAITAGALGTSDLVSITTTGSGSVGVLASGAGSTITIDDPSIVTRGLGTPGALADSGGSVVLNGGTVTTHRAGSFGVGALPGSSISVNGHDDQDARQCRRVRRPTRRRPCRWDRRDRYADQRQVGHLGSAGHRCSGGGRGRGGPRSVDLSQSRRREAARPLWS